MEHGIYTQRPVFSTISMFFNENLIRFTGKSKIHYTVGLIIFPFLLAFSYFAVMMDKVYRSKNIFFSYLVVVKKV